MLHCISLSFNTRQNGMWGWKYYAFVKHLTITIIGTIFWVRRSMFSSKSSRILDFRCYLTYIQCYQLSYLKKHIMGSKLPICKSKSEWKVPKNFKIMFQLCKTFRTPQFPTEVPFLCKSQWIEFSLNCLVYLPNLIKSCY